MSGVNPLDDMAEDLASTYAEVTPKLPHLPLRDNAHFEAGRAAERAEIVAWIRHDLPRRVIVEHRPDDVHPRNLADAIERGEHVSGSSGKPHGVPLGSEPDGIVG